ncbi:MAG: phosphate/phosphite/phosphonate ABC transporter substrate-binding protein [Candidatus Latescibacterota bacterium]
MRNGLTALGLAIFLLLIACAQKEEVTRINLFEKKKGVLESKATSAETPLRIGVSPMFSPRETLASYERLVTYIGERIGRPAVLKQRRSYYEINDMLRSNQLDCAFICGGAYVEARDEGYIEILVVPVVRGELVYHSYIIVPKESEVETFDELQGKVFAFTDPLSNSGRMVPEFMLLQLGHSPGSFFSKTIYSYSHDRSIELVADRKVDGGAVDSLVWEFMEAMGSKSTAGTRIIRRSPPYGIPPVVVPSTLDPTLKDKLRQALLSLHLDPQGREMMGAIAIDRFVQGGDQMYDSIRAMRASMKAKSEGK